MLSAQIPYAKEIQGLDWLLLPCRQHELLSTPNAENFWNICFLFQHTEKAETCSSWIHTILLSSHTETSFLGLSFSHETDLLVTKSPLCSFRKLIVRQVLQPQGALNALFFILGNVFLLLMRVLLIPVEVSRKDHSGIHCYFTYKIATAFCQLMDEHHYLHRSYRRGSCNISDYRKGTCFLCWVCILLLGDAKVGFCSPQASRWFKHFLPPQLGLMSSLPIVSTLCQIIIYLSSPHTTRQVEIQSNGRGRDLYLKNVFDMRPPKGLGYCSSPEFLVLSKPHSSRRCTERSVLAAVMGTFMFWVGKEAELPWD